MSFTRTGTYDGSVILLDDPVELENQTRVRVILEPEASPPKRSFLETAKALQVSGPTDWATNFEKYLHGPLAGDD